jgi:hypothetical protein
MAQEKLITRITEIAESLNERQRAYLVVAYDEDQRAEQANSGPGSVPASQWRWLEYGPDGRVRRMTYDGPLRYALAEMKLVGHGAGSTWHSLESRGLLNTDHRLIGLGDLMSLYVRLTTDGRRVARVLKGLPMQKPKIDPASKPMSLTALLVYFRAPFSKSWAEALDNRLTDYEPIDHEAYATFHHATRERGGLDLPAVFSWIEQEMTALSAITPKVPDCAAHKFISKPVKPVANDRSQE